MLRETSAPASHDASTEPPLVVRTTATEAASVRSVDAVLDELFALKRGSGRDGRREWYPVRRRGVTRLLIPHTSAGIDGALQMVNSRRKAVALRAALLLSRRLTARRRVTSRVAALVLDDWLAPLFPGESFTYAAYCGTPSEYAKITVQCQDPHGRPRAYIKVGIGPRAEASIEREVHVLHGFEGAQELAGSCPRVLALHRHVDLPVAILSAAPANARRAPAFPTREIARFGAQVFASDRAVHPWEGSPARQRLCAASESLERSGEEVLAMLLRAADQVMARRCGSRTLQHGRSHGDFLPWNLRLAPFPFAFDWEWSRTTLAGHDLLHYVLFPRIQRFDDPERIASVLRSVAWRQLLSDEALSADMRQAGGDSSLLGYVADALAFYAESASAAGQSLHREPLIRRLAALLELVLKLCA